MLLSSPLLLLLRVIVAVGGGGGSGCDTVVLDGVIPGSTVVPLTVPLQVDFVFDVASFLSFVILDTSLFSFSTEAMQVSVFWLSSSAFNGIHL